MSVLNVVVYLADSTGYQISMPDGKNATTEKYFTSMAEALCIPEASAKKYFSLWLKSPLLDLQLKMHHVPFRMVKQWSTFIERFSMGSIAEKAKDEPALFFKRNAFLFKEDEVANDNPDVFEVLLMQAKENIHRGNYPCDREDAEQLCVLSCLMKKTTLEAPDNIKKTIQEALPQHMQKAKRFLSRQQSVEEKIFSTYKNTVMKEDVEDAPQEFMKICWQLPYYGCTFFDGFVTQVGNSWLHLVHHETTTPVHVGINMDGVWVIDKEKKLVLIGLNYGEFNWETATPPVDDSNNQEETMPSLFIEFGEEKKSKLLQVNSKQASMMSSMIDTCTMLRQERDFIAKSPKKKNNAVVDKPLPSAVQSKRVRPLLDRQNSVTKSHPEKLALASFGKEEENGNKEDEECTHESHHRNSSSSTSPSKHPPLKKQHSFRFFRHFANKHKQEATIDEEQNDLLTTATH